MASGDKSIPLEHATAIEKFTGGFVTRRDIRPDDWRDIWPELADSEPKHTQALTQQAQVATETVALGVAHA